MKSAVWGEARSRILPGTERREATSSSTARFPGFCSRLKSPVLALYSLGIHRKFGATGFEPRVALDLLPYLLRCGRPKLLRWRRTEARGTEGNAPARRPDSYRNDRTAADTSGADARSPANVLP